MTKNNWNTKVQNFYQPSLTKSWQWNLSKTLLQTSVFWLIFLFLLPWAIWELEAYFHLPHFKAVPFVGWGGFALFGSLGIWSGVTMSLLGKGTPLPLDAPNKLVIKGPYQWLRNPMAVAGIGQGVCMGLIMGSYGVMLYALAGAPLWHYLVRPSEEADLAKRFGAAYLDYKKQIKCWWPSARYRSASGKKEV